MSDYNGAWFALYLAQLSPFYEWDQQFERETGKTVPPNRD